MTISGEFRSVESVGSLRTTKKFLRCLDLIPPLHYLSGMRTKAEQFSSTTVLLLRWWALWRIAEAFARGILRAKKFDPARAAEEAAQLEVWSRCALFTLLGEIAAIETSDTGLSKQDSKDLAHAKGIVGALAMLCALAAKVKRGCAVRMNKCFLVSSPAGLPAAPIRAQTRPAPAYLDSS